MRPGTAAMTKLTGEATLATTGSWQYRMVLAARTPGAAMSPVAIQETPLRCRIFMLTRCRASGQGTCRARPSEAVGRNGRSPAGPHGARHPR